MSHREHFIYGGAGSGKSYAVAQHLILQLLGNDYFRCVYMRKVARTIRNSQFLLFKDIINNWNISHLFDVKEVDMSIVCKSNGNMLISAGADDIEKIKSIQEPNCIWIEEATEFSLIDYLQLQLRLRTRKAFNYTIATFNPVSKSHWLYDYISKKANDVNVIKTTYKDNQFIDEAYVLQLQSLKQQDEDYYNVYALGEWGTGDRALVYKYEIGLFPENIDGADVFYGIDFGYINPTAIVQCVIIDGRVYVRELLYQSNLTNSKLISKMNDLIEHKHHPIYCDSEDKNRIEELYNNGYNVYPSNKNVSYGISVVNSFVPIIDKHSTNLIAEIENYKFMKDKNGNITDKPVKFKDHLMDAMRYAITTHTEKIGNKPDIRIKKYKIKMV
jgi:phage terminase large subunit